MDEKIMILTSMGFEEEQVVHALTMHYGNVEEAANFLLWRTTNNLDDQNEGGARMTRTAPSPRHAATSSYPSRQGAQMVVGPISQYTVENGKSACTCMALAAAVQFLQNASKTTPLPSMNLTWLDSSFLQNMIFAGLAVYDRLISSQQRMTSGGISVEHMSAEEVLQSGVFPLLQLVGEIRQGILSNNQNNDNPQGLRQLLLGFRPKSGWTCFVMTKTPETVLICLGAPPPDSIQDQSTPKKDEAEGSPCILIDSHPRSQQFGADEAYARIHDNLEDLIVSLNAIFPAIDLNDDIGEIMGAMYNSFDLYPLQLR